ncbi:hypothetical protein CHELA40_15160 [Chelatococcus asaccharovorans]|nr:hypothetical protein CHELA17_60459 [Chelatococcus asaccharovorans]CAH1681683.1 hypothetical protein CHELA40_15160 [Chelatococcus asaccharovorans]
MKIASEAFRRHHNDRGSTPTFDLELDVGRDSQVKFAPRADVGYQPAFPFSSTGQARFPGCALERGRGRE